MGWTRENVRAFFPQGESKLFMGVSLKRVWLFFVLISLCNNFLTVTFCNISVCSWWHFSLHPNIDPLKFHLYTTTTKTLKINNKRFPCHNQKNMCPYKTGLKKINGMLMHHFNFAIRPPHTPSNGEAFVHLVRSGVSVNLTPHYGSWATWNWQSDLYRLDTS